MLTREEVVSQLHKADEVRAAVLARDYWEFVKPCLSDPSFEFENTKLHSILDRAIKFGPIQAVELLLKDPRVYLQSLDNEYSSPLIDAIKMAEKYGGDEQISIVALLMADERISLETIEKIKDKRGGFKNPTINEAYMQRKAKEEELISKLHKFDEEGIVFCARDHLEIVKRCLADPQFKLNTGIREILSKAVLFGQLELVEFLLKDPQIDPFYFNSDYTNPLKVAIRQVEKSGEEFPKIIDMAALLMADERIKLETIEKIKGVKGGFQNPKISDAYEQRKAKEALKTATAQPQATQSKPPTTPLAKQPAGLFAGESQALKDAKKRLGGTSIATRRKPGGGQ